MKKNKKKINDFLKLSKIAGFDRIQLFWVESPPNMEAVMIAGGGWALQKKGV